MESRKERATRWNVTQHNTTPLTFLLRRTIPRTPIRHQIRIIRKRLAQHTPTPINIARARTTDDGPGRLICGRVGIFLAIGIRCFSVVEFLRGGDGGEAVDQLEV